MTDRELLELAAKAAGIFCRGWCLPGARSDGWYGMYTGDPNEGSYVRWNPLTDDGDAFQLAIALGLIIDCSRPSAGEPFKQHHVWLDEFCDTATLTRRAIVLAAAEIGKGLRPFPSDKEIRENWT